MGRASEMWDLDCSVLVVTETSGLQTSSETEELSSEMLESLRVASKQSLYFFAKAILGYSWLNEKIHLPLCLLLQDQTRRRKKITLPRSWLKSTICTIALPLFRVINDSNVRVLIVQNSASNAVAKLRAIRSAFEQNQLFRALWPELLPGTQNVWRDDSLCVSGRTRSGLVESTFEAAGTKTKLTGRHYDVIVEDDTVAPDLDDMTVDMIIPSKADIEQAIGWHKQMNSLLVDVEASENVVVGTRWAELDLLSYIDAHESKFYVSYERSCRETNGQSDPDGEITYPERFGESALEMLEAAWGTYMFSCLYLNRPLRSKDMVFQASWFKFFDIEPKNLVVMMSVDPATDSEQTKGKNTDFNVIVVTGKNVETGTVYLLDYWRERCNPGKLLAQILEMNRKWHPIKTLIETVAYQNTIMYHLNELMKKHGQWFMVEGVTHGRTSKTARIKGLQPVVQSGSLMFRTWMKDLLAEMETFPLGAHDDIVDCLAMQVKFWGVTSGAKRSKQIAQNNPLSLEACIEEFRERANARSSRGEIYDVFGPSQEFEAPSEIAPWSQN